MKKMLFFILTIVAIVLVACTTSTETTVQEVTSTPAATQTGTPATTTAPSAENQTATAGNQTTTSTTLNCVDSDKGLNSFDSGYVDDIDKVRHPDKCVGKTLVEWYCSLEGQAKSKELTCPGNCNAQGTACEKPAEISQSEQQAQQQQQSQTQTAAAVYNCTDSDNGINYNVQGSCKDGKQYPAPFADFCTGSRDLVELACDKPTDSCQQTSYTCPGSCVNGKCI